VRHTEEAFFFIFDHGPDRDSRASGCHQDTCGAREFGMASRFEQELGVDDAPRTQAQLFAQKKRRDMELKKNQTGVPTDDDLRVHF